MIYKVLAVAILVAISNANNCIPRRFKSDSIVCVCNATYCDETPNQEPVIPENGIYYRYTSSKLGKRLNFSRGTISSSSTHISWGSTVTLDSNKTYQKISGFGGAFTDAAGINIGKLRGPTQDVLLRQYFDPVSGSRYSFGRVPIGGTDFSVRRYTYDDTDGDIQLLKFSLADEDDKYKAPYMSRALKLNPEMKFVAAAWSAPPWMKTNNNITGYGFLKEEYYQVYTNYILKFLRAYKHNGFDFWAVSTGNEPLNAYFPFVKFNKMGWTPATLATWVAEHLGPSLANSEFNDIKIMTIDDQRINIPLYPKLIFSNEKAKKYIDIVAVHWYLDKYIPAIVLDKMHQWYPDKELLMTEACTGTTIGSESFVSLGSWKRAEEYILDIIENLSHWVTGWIDWNLALDVNGGPNWANNFADSAIIVEPRSDEFYKQPMYYAIKHFSRFVKPKSHRIEISSLIGLKTIAFTTPQNEIVVVLYNRGLKTRTISIRDVERGTISLKMEPYSIDTIVYRK